MAIAQDITNFNSLAPCGANPWLFDCRSHLGISTHSPRVGRTFFGRRAVLPKGHFNSLAPCGANRHPDHAFGDRRRFQLTRPVWGEPRVRGWTVLSTDISTHSPRVGRTSVYFAFNDTTYISTHSPRVGRTVVPVCQKMHICISTHSPRVGRTKVNNTSIGKQLISTHSPRVGRTKREGM